MKPCQAYALSTNDRCKKKALPGSRYCMVHQSWGFNAVAAIVSIIIGALLGLLFENVYRIYVPSRETREIEHLRKELSDKDNKIEELNKFILSSITGGDSFCYFSIGSFSSDNSAGYLILTHKGKYAIHGIQARIDDKNSRRTVTSGASLEGFMRTQKILNIGTLYPGFNKVYRKLDLSGKNNIKWDIFFAASNGFSTQTLRLMLVDGHWVSATRVETYPDFKVIYEQVDPNFPKDEKGEVKWD